MQRGLALMRSKRRMRILKLEGLTPATYEEQIARALKDVGPLITVGDPKERLPKLGAARLYLRDSEWREKVEREIKRSCLVFMQAGVSAGFIWELEAVVKAKSQLKLILGLPLAGACGEKRRRAQYDDFRAKSVSVLPELLPEKIGDAQFIYFDEDWTPRLFTPSKHAWPPQSYKPEDGQRAAQWRALWGLWWEFRLASTPYWLRWSLCMLVLLLPTLFILLLALLDL